MAVIEDHIAEAEAIGTQRFLKFALALSSCKNVSALYVQPTDCMTEASAQLTSDQLLQATTSHRWRLWQPTSDR